MNYFELHIGDLTEATAHLTLLEDGAYGRLMRKYYATEKPLPADLATVQRLVGARSKEERAAVDAVLQEFFELQDDGWHQSRCDAEIAAFHGKQQGAEGKRENAKERQRRARERRAQLFDTLRTHGIVPPWTTTSAELETLLSRVTSGDVSQPVTPPVTRDDTATQTPDTNLQTPDSRKERVGRASRLPPTWDPGNPGFAFAEQQGLSNGRAQAELEKFRDYWAAKPGKDGTKADWMATWRSWVRKAVEYQAGRGTTATDDVFGGAR